MSNLIEMKEMLLESVVTRKQAKELDIWTKEESNTNIILLPIYCPRSKRKKRTGMGSSFVVRNGGLISYISSYESKRDDSIELPTKTLEVDPTYCCVIE